ncbi:MAG: hypothetical protein AAB456_01285, partial [Patescibacteria group bacterium]
AAMPLNEALGQVLDAIRAMPNANDRAAASFRLLGRSPEQMMRLVRGGGEGLRQAAREGTLPAEWPKWRIIDFGEERLLETEEYDLVIQVNGKMRDKIRVSKRLERPEIEKLAMASVAVKKYIDGKKIKKIIFVPNRLINIVVS